MSYTVRKSVRGVSIRVLGLMCQNRKIASQFSQEKKGSVKTAKEFESCAATQKDGRVMLYQTDLGNSYRNRVHLNFDGSEVQASFDSDISVGVQFPIVDMIFGSNGELGSAYMQAVAQDAFIQQGIAFETLPDVVQDGKVLVGDVVVNLEDSATQQAIQNTML